MTESRDDEPVGADAPADGVPEKPRRRGLARRLLRALVVAVCLFVAAMAIAVVWTETPWFKDWLRRYIERQATSALDGELTVGRLQGSLYTGIELDRVVLTQRGEPVVSIDRVNVRYRILEIIARGIVLDELILDHPTIAVRQTADGWNVTRLVRARPSKPGSTGLSLAITSLRVNDGRVVIERDADDAARRAAPTRIDDLDAQLGLVARGGTLAFDLTHVSFDIADPALRVGHLGGRFVRRADTITLERLRLDLPASNLRVDGTITGIGTSAVADLSIASSGLAFREVGLFLPAVRSIPLQPAFTARVRGPLRTLDTDLHLESSAGRADGRVLVDLSPGGPRFAGELALARVNPAPWAAAPAFTGLVTGRARFDLRLPDSSRNRPFTGTFQFTGPDARLAGYAAQDVDVRGRLAGSRVAIAEGRAHAYGADVTVAGTIEPVPGDAPGVQYSLAGHARQVDLRNLPATLPIPALDSLIEADYSVRGRAGDFTGEAALSDSTVEGARLAAGTRGHFSLENGRMAYGGSGRISGLSLPRFGEALELGALTDERLAGSVSGTFTLEASGRGAKELQLTADAHLDNTTLLGAELPDMVVKASIAGGRLTADLAGEFAKLAPDFVTGASSLSGLLAGRLEGRATVQDLTGAITLDTVGFDGRIDLEHSTLRGVEIAAAHLVGAFIGRTGRLDEATLSGPLGDLNASGPLSLDASGSSQLSYTISRADLARVSALFDQSLAGTAVLQGTLTGNGAALVTTGTAHVEQAAVGEPVKAEALDVRYTVTLPDLDPARLGVDADVSGRGVSVAGQRIRTLTAKVGYRERTVAFDARAVDGARTIDARGRAELQEGRQHVVLSSLAATVDGLTWQLQPGAEAVIDYDGRQIEIGGLSLAHETARVHADGTLVLGDDGESHLEIRVEHLQIAEVDRLLERPAPQYTGVLDGNATVRGSLSRPEVAAQFAVTQGAFRELRFQELSGIVHYDGRFFGTDMTLVQQPGTTLTAKGLVPLSLIQGDDAAKGQDPIDLRVESTTIGLEVASGLTTAVTELGGTARIDLHVTGTADNPLFEGGVDLSGGAFTLAPVGRHYSGITSTLRFQPGRMIIDRLRVLDENEDVMEVSGELGLRRTAFGTVSLDVKASEFGVLRNELGNADVDATLRVTGDLTAPKVQGDIAFHTGRIEVDAVLAKLTGGVYATEPLDSVPIPGEGIRPDDTPTVGRITTASGRQRSVVVENGPPAAEPRPGAAAAAPAARASVRKGVLDGATLDIRVKIPDNLVLRGRDIRTSSTSLGLGNVNITVGGDFRVRKDPGTPTALVGAVNTVRGTYDFRGRRFDILRDGRIQFQGTQPIDPALDVTAQRVIQPSGVEARIRIQGTASNPTLSFSSDPPLDEADILALIVFNRPLNSLGSNEKTSLVDLAGTTAAGFVVSPLTQSLGRALNLDLFEVQATSEGGGAGGQVTIGQQVGERLYFKFRQQFGAQEVSEFVLEYQLSSFLRLQAAAADGDGVGRANRSLTRRIERAGLDLIFYFSY